MKAPSATELHKAYETLKNTRPHEAKALKRDNPGVGCIWAYPQVSGAKPILIDPETGRCVYDRARRPVVAINTSMAPQNLHGVTPPPVKRPANAANHQLSVDTVSLAKALGVPVKPAMSQQTKGTPLYRNGQPVMIQATGPVVAPYDDLKASGAVPATLSRSMDDYAGPALAKKLANASVTPFAEALADVLEGR